MAGRNRLPRQPEGFREFHKGPPPPIMYHEPGHHEGPPPPVMYRGPGPHEGPLPHVMYRGPGPLPIHPAALEEELEIQHRDMQRILSENRHVIDENVMLQRELTAVKEEIHRLGQVIPKLRADGELETRELIDRGLKLEDELRAIEPLRAEVTHLRSESQKLNGLKKDLSTQFQDLTKDIARAKADNKQLNSLKAEVDGLHKELMEARRAIEYEKKANEEQVEQKQAMERNLISIAREIEKLRSEQIGADIRGYGAGGGGGYGSTYKEVPEMRYSISGYGDTYGKRAWSGSYDKHGPPKR